MRCFYSSDLDFNLDLPEDHPFPGDKYSTSRDMLLQNGVLRPEEIIDVSQTDLHVLKRVHEGEYLSKIYHGALDLREQAALGLPANPQLFARCATEAEATRQTCHAALAEGVAVCLAGGTHHAFKGRGEGFCVFNDVAIAVRDLQEKRPGIRIMIVDTDAHQGNGTNSLLQTDPRVFTYSIHVGQSATTTTPVDGSMDVETVRYVEGDMYLKQLFSTLASALDVFNPDLVIWVAGADNHSNDLLGNMMLSVSDMQRRDDVIIRAFIKNRIPLAILYGGGYNRHSGLTAKLHRNTVASAKKIAKEFGKG
ncbi:MAG: histone deacetylase [Verrucomicrobiae bacterium]|nr:histone deacetylase [Verrucomicrobiae bacterium]NNJ86544.1 histone deacetylase [Akkermansiaceae bacterium]